MSKSPIYHRWYTAYRCDMCGEFGDNLKMVPICPNCGNKVTHDRHHVKVRLIQYTMLHKFLSLLAGHGWPSDQLEFVKIDDQGNEIKER